MAKDPLSSRVDLWGSEPIEKPPAAYDDGHAPRDKDEYYGPDLGVNNETPSQESQARQVASTPQGAPLDSNVEKTRSRLSAMKFPEPIESKLFAPITTISSPNWFLPLAKLDQGQMGQASICGIPCFARMTSSWDLQILINASSEADLEKGRWLFFEKAEREIQELIKNP